MPQQWSAHQRKEENALLLGPISSTASYVRVCCFVRDASIHVSSLMLLIRVNWDSCHDLLLAKGRSCSGSDVIWNACQDSLLA